MRRFARLVLVALLLASAGGAPAQLVPLVQNRPPSGCGADPAAYSADLWWGDSANASLGNVTISTNEITAWGETSGTGCSSCQTNWTSSSNHPDEIGTEEAVDFNATAGGEYMNSAASVTGITTFTLFLVVYFDAGNDMWLEQSAAVDPNEGFNFYSDNSGGAITKVYKGSTAMAFGLTGGVTIDTTYRVYRVQYDGTEPDGVGGTSETEIWIDGTEQATSVGVSGTPGTGATSGTVYLGSRNNGTIPADGRMKGGAVFSPMLSDADAACMQTYFESVRDAT